VLLAEEVSPSGIQLILIGLGLRVQQVRGETQIEGALGSWYWAICCCSCAWASAPFFWAAPGRRSQHRGVGDELNVAGLAAPGGLTSGPELAPDPGLADACVCRFCVSQSASFLDNRLAVVLNWSETTAARPRWHCRAPGRVAPGPAVSPAPSRACSSPAPTGQGLLVGGDRRALRATLTSRSPPGRPRR